MAIFTWIPRVFLSGFFLLMTQSLFSEELSFEGMELGYQSHVEEISSTDSATGDLENRIAEYQAVIQELMQREGSPFYDLHGRCLDFSALLKEELHARGYPLDLAQTAPNDKPIYISGKDGKEIFSDKRHFFLVDRSLGAQSEIILDPTIMQFFHKAPGRVEIRKIFVGTKTDLIAFYTKNQKDARLFVTDEDDQVIDDNQGHYDPRDLVCAIYSVDQCSHTRTNF